MTAICIKIGRNVLLNEKENIFSYSPYSKDKEWRNTIFRRLLIELTKHHQNNCEIYRNILAASNFVLRDESKIEELPFLPASLFKHLTLTSVPADSIQRTLTSSGTSRQTVSKIYLDSKTSVMQMRALACIISDFLGKEQLPILILDCPSVLKDYSQYSARGAGIQGFSIYGKSRTFALNDQMQPNIAEIEKFGEMVNGNSFFMFGFTYMIWQHLYKYFKNNGIKLDLSNGILIHGGGWKHLIAEQITDEVFKSCLLETFGLKKIYNYYGMVEQTGSIYMQCECGHLHCSNFSDIFIRRVEDFAPCKIGETGIIQTISILPYSFPGHSLLTEDEGVLLGEDDCACGRNGKYFKVNRRLTNAELRGCGDIYAANY